MHIGRTKRFGRGALVSAAVLGLAISATAPAGGATVDRTAETSSGDISAQVVGGGEVGLDQFPSMVALLVVSPGKTARERFFCTGTLIAPRKVLTAAHCATVFYEVTTRGRIRGIEVQVGKRDLGNANATYVRATSAVMHKNWATTSTLSYDVAVVTLASAVAAPVARLATAGEGALAAGNVKVAGWGLTSQVRLGDWFFDDQLPPKRAQVADIPVMADNDCVDLFEDSVMDDFVEPATDVCAGEVGKGACYGDSGGPLYKQAGGEMVQIGVTSRSVGCAIIFPAVFTDVSAMRTWIDRRVSTPCRTPADPSEPDFKVYAC